ncbi:MAG: hypothetical protein F6K26_31325 [Moorea sp. SIO2I5]|nr:hypothetical protein [Moorena sp. SIO2I5]
MSKSYDIRVEGDIGVSQDWVRESQNAIANLKVRTRISKCDRKSESGLANEQTVRYESLLADNIRFRRT